MINDKKITNIVRNFLNSIDGVDTESCIIILCNTLVHYIDRFVDEDDVDKVFDTFKKVTLAGLEELKTLRSLKRTVKKNERIH